MYIPIHFFRVIFWIANKQNVMSNVCMYIQYKWNGIVCIWIAAVKINTKWFACLLRYSFCLVRTFKPKSLSICISTIIESIQYSNRLWLQYKSAAPGTRHIKLDKWKMKLVCVYLFAGCIRDCTNTNLSNRINTNARNRLNSF